MMRDFLVALSAKDCSIIVTLAAFPGCAQQLAAQLAVQHGGGAVFVAVGEQGGSDDWVAQVAVVDTDIRPVAKVAAYHVAELEILEAAASHFQ